MTRRTDPAQRGARLVWLDLLKAVAIGWIFLNHSVERLFGYPYFANPNAAWPPLAERLEQLRPMVGHGLLDLPLNLARYLGWAGDQGVQLFLIASGFAIAWSLLADGTPAALDGAAFFRRRAARIYPLWWGAHAVLIASYLVSGWGMGLLDERTWASFFGLRVTPGQLYYGVPAWWYIGLQLQLYLALPLLWRTLRRVGPTRAFVGLAAIAFAIRAIGLLAFDDYLDAWSRGAIFLTRLPEFLFGIVLAVWYRRNPAGADRRLRSPASVGLALTAYVLGSLLSLTLLGMTVAPFLLGAGALGLLYTPLSALERHLPRLRRMMRWAGRHSYSLYLTHHPLILVLVPASAGRAAQLAGVGLALVATPLCALLLERIVAAAVAAVSRWKERHGLPGTLLRAAAVPLGLATLIAAAELTVRRIDPQEILGWGERPALEPHPELGWRLVPNRRTRLRWESYDYVVEANGLGFPGPEYPENRSPGTLRILATGDAFTSAEGVDTGLSWPRRLESELRARRPGRPVEVLNFAITGYGPEQYAAVVEEFVPRYRPDLVLVGFFVNEYDDAHWTHERFRQSIGFAQPAPDSRYARLRPLHLRRWVELQVLEPLGEILLRRPAEHRYFLGYVSALERGRASYVETGRELVAGQLARIDAVTRAAGAEVWLVLIPAPVQVCGPADLAYYPRYLDLDDAARYDLEQPQRLTAELAGELGLELIDLLPLLRERAGDCPYQSRNLHWTAAGHQVVAFHLADRIHRSREGASPDLLTDHGYAARPDRARRRDRSPTR